jgi:acyl-coenzyme A thioesterase PaaI-like protein
VSAQDEHEQQETESEATEAVAGANKAASAKPFYEYWNDRDFVRWMGARITQSSDGVATVYFEPGEHHRGAGAGGQAVTGAVQAYIFDIVTGAAVASLAHGLRPQVTVSLDVTYEYPAYDAPLTFEARVQGGGKQVVFVEGECRDVNGRICSRVRAIFRRFEKRLETPPPIAAQ